MGGTPYDPNAPAPQQPPPPMWMPASQPTAMHGGMRMMNWTMLGFAAKALGFALVFIGSLVLVSVTNPSPTPPPNTTVSAGILAGRLLWVIGLAFIAGGAGIKLRYVFGMPATDVSESQSRLIRTGMWRNTVVFLVALILMIWILSFLPLTLTSTGIV